MRKLVRKHAILEVRCDHTCMSHIDQSFVVCNQIYCDCESQLAKIVGNFTLYHVYCIGSCFINK